MNLGKRLLQARKARGMRQNEIAELASEIGGVPLSQAAYQKLESRDSESSIYLFAMAKALRVNPEWLQTGKGDSGLDIQMTQKSAVTANSTEKPDKDLQAIIGAWNTIDVAGRALLLETLKIAGEHFGRVQQRTFEPGRSPIVKGLPNARPADANKRPQTRVSHRRRK